DLWGNGGGKGPLQAPGLLGPGQTLLVGAHIGPPSRLLSLKIQGDLPLRGAHHANELTLGLHLPAAQALAHGYFFRHSPSPPMIHVRWDGRLTPPRPSAPRPAPADPLRPPRAPPRSPR